MILLTFLVIFVFVPFLLGYLLDIFCFCYCYITSLACGSKAFCFLSFSFVIILVTLVCKKHYRDMGNNEMPAANTIQVGLRYFIYFYWLLFAFI